jgi:spermidine synthase
MSRSSENKPAPLIGVQESPVKFIEVFLASVKCNSYLELGLLSGQTLRYAGGVVPHCVGVDKEPHRQFEKQKPRTIVHVMTTDKFFEANEETFDVIYIDADHSFKQVKKDFHNSVKILNPNGFILLHDTDPARPEKIQPQFCHDVYKMVDYVRKLGEYDILTLPTAGSGMSIVSRKTNRRVLRFIGEL